MNQIALLFIVMSFALSGCGGPESGGEAAEDTVAAGWAGADFSAAAPGAATGPAAVCEVAESGKALPVEVGETSGLARSAREADLFWTHNDAGNGPFLYGVDGAGRLIQRVRVSGARLADWEDLETARCEDAFCLYVADIGDNDGERDRITIYRLAEPPAAATESAPADALHARFPDGPRDAEALFVDKSGDLYIVNKGRGEPIALYRYPGPQRPAATVVLERVRILFPEPEGNDDRVTAATATPDGRWVGIRTYRALYLYPAGELIGGGSVEPAVVDLSPLGEVQGEGLAMADDGTVWVSSEAEGGSQPPRWARLQCALP